MSCLLTPEGVFQRGKRKLKKEANKPLFSFYVAEH